jgi:hypothetical protein
MSMSIKLDDGAGHEWGFDPGRDIAYFWPQLLSETERLLQRSTQHPIMRAYFDAVGIKDDLEPRKCCLALMKGFENSIVTELRTADAAFIAGGLGEFNTQIVGAVFLALSVVATGAFWDGIRRAAVQGVVPANIRQLAVFRQELEDSINAEVERRQATQSGDEAAPEGTTPCESDFAECADNRAD